MNAMTKQQKDGYRKLRVSASAWHAGFFHPALIFPQPPDSRPTPIRIPSGRSLWNPAKTRVLHLAGRELPSC